MKYTENHPIYSTLFKAWCACLVFGLSGCNLFIDDEEEWVKDIPVHTGYGYDMPVREDGEFYTLTYQLKSNVNILSDESLKYLRQLHNPISSMVMFFDYDINTPKELLPVRGEILLHGECDKIPDGIAQQVIGMAEMDGVKRVMTCCVPFEDLFTNIDLDMDVAKGLNLQGLGDSDVNIPSENDNPSENGDDSGNAAYANQSNMFGYEDVQIGERFKSNTFIPIPDLNFSTEDLKKPEEKDKYNVVNIEGNVHIKSINELDDDNSLKIDSKIALRLLKVSDEIRIPFSLAMDGTIDYKPNIDLDGTVKIDADVLREDDIFPPGVGVYVPIGGVPVFFKFCCGAVKNLKLELTYGGSIKARIPISFKTEKYISELTGLNPISITSTAISTIWGDNDITWDWKKGYFAFEHSRFSADSKVTLELSPGVGLFVQDISFRCLLSGSLECKLSTLAANGGDFPYGMSFRNDEGIEVKPTLGIGLMVTVPKDLATVMNGIVESTANIQKIVGYCFAYLAFGGETEADIKNGYIESVDKLNEMIKGLKTTVNEKDHFDLRALPFTTHPLHKTFPWLPPTHDKHPFSPRKIYSKLSKGDRLLVNYSVKGGSYMPIFTPVIPCMIVTKEDGSFVKFLVNKTIFSNGKNYIDRNLVIGEDGLKIEYDIPLKDMPNDVLLFHPGYYYGGGTLNEDDFVSGNPKMFDRHFAFLPPERVNTKRPSKTKLNWIQHIENVPWTSKEHPYYRTFMVNWDVIDPYKDMADSTGIKCQLYSDSIDNKFHTQAVKNGVKNYQTMIMYYIKKNDVNPKGFEVYPYAIRVDGSLHGDYDEGEFWSGQIEDGHTIIFNDDGSTTQVKGGPYGNAY